MARSGGGYDSRVVKHSTDYKTEPVPHKASPAGAAQQGMAVQFKKEPLEAGRGYEPGKMGPTGSRGIYDGSAMGPGSGRTTYRAGSQSATPPAREMLAGREILGAYGPEISGPSRRR
jgi:hypothetical protein